jgi:hypothetical protein
MKIDGGCHCGYIAYEAETDPAEARICHCTDCQTLSGSRLSYGSSNSGGFFQASVWRIENICKDRRKRHGPATIILSELRNTNLFHDGWKRP